jgi:hydrogenase 3 maturation protease
MNFDIFNDALSNYSKRKIVFVGIGNELRGDDKAGLLFLKNLESTGYYNNSTFIYAGTNPENYLEKILKVDPELVLFVDAVSCDKCEEDIFWIPGEEIMNMSISTHAFSIKMVEDYLKKQKNISILYLGIKCYDTEFGNPLTPQVKETLDKFFQK